MNTQTKTYRITSRLRFTLFVALLIIITVTCANSMLGFYNASSLTVQEFTELEISSGDTLWNIAQEYMPEDMSLRSAVHELCAINGISASELYAGQTILIPVYNN